MNILQVLNSGKPGGMEQHVLDLVSGFRSRGHNVTVVCCDGEIVEWYKKAGAQVITAKVGFEIDLLYIFKLIKVIKKNKIHIIHAHELKASANAMLAGFFSRTKVRITHIHTPISEWKIPNLIKQLWTYLTILGYSIEVAMFSTMEIALTQTRKRVKLKEGIKKNKLRVIPNGLDLERFTLTEEQKAAYRQEIRQRYNIPPDALVIGNVSRMTEEKGHKILIRAFKEFFDNVSLEVPDNKYHLFLAGGGELENEIRQLVIDYKLDRRTLITGVFPDEDLPKFYSTFDLFVFPSLAEGFGYVLVEAMFSKVPVIASDLAVLKEVSKDSITFFETGNRVSLANRIKYLSELLANRDNSSQQLTENPYEIVRDNYSMDRFIDNYENLYRESLSKK